MNRANDREESPHGTGRRTAAISLVTAAALSTMSAPAGADGPPAQQVAQRPGEKDLDKAKKPAPLPGPVPVAINPASLRNRTAAELESMAHAQAKAQVRALAMADQFRRQAAVEADLKILIEKMPEKFRPADAKQVFEWGSALLGGEPYTLDRYRRLKSVYWTEVASRYGQNVMVVNNAIAGK